MTKTATALASLSARRDDVRRRADGEPGWLAQRREQAWERFSARGLPTVRDEEWKYTDVSALGRLALDGAAPAAGRTPDPAAFAAAHGLHLHGGVTLVFLDGRFAPALSGGPGMPAGAHVGSLAAAVRAFPDLVEPHLARVAAGGDRPFADLSTALFEDGAFVHLSQATCLPVPIDVLYASTGGRGGRHAACFPRTLVVAEAETRVTVLERHVALSGGAYATFPVTEVALARNAAVEHVLWQGDHDEAFHVATVEARQDRDSRFAAHALTLGGGLTRTDTGVRLQGEGAECALDGLYVVFGTRHSDHHTRIDHAAPHGTSREVYKGILDGHGTGVFDGKVVVRPGAVKTDSQQANHNLLLSEDAVADTRPELEIYNDDVKCSHGATVGRLEEDKLFYLRSRGIDARAARDLLLRAFARDVTDRISIEAVQTRIARWMEARLPALAGAEAGA